MHFFIEMYFFSLEFANVKFFYKQKCQAQNENSTLNHTSHKQFNFHKTKNKIKISKSKLILIHNKPEYSLERIPD